MEAHRSDSAPAPDAAAGADRDAKIEQLLLVGLDHYFAGRLEHAINVWTRALFLDRSHARARAYIERARSALAEGQRESEELLQNGVAAFHRGDGDEARRLLRSAIDRGAPSEEALALLDRLDRADTVPPPVVAAPAERSTATMAAATVRRRSVSARAALMLGVAAVAALAAFAAAASGAIDWRALLPADAPTTTLSAPIPRDVMPAPPRRGELSLARARTLAAAGHLRDALVALDGVRPTDAERPEADRLRADIQRQLIAFVTLPPAPERDTTSERPIP